MDARCAIVIGRNGLGVVRHTRGRCQGAFLENESGAEAVAGEKGLPTLSYSLAARWAWVQNVDHLSSLQIRLLETRAPSS